MNRQRRTSSGLGFARFLLNLLLLGVGAYLIYSGWQYLLVRDRLTMGTMIGRVDVSQMTAEEARTRVIEVYSRPVQIRYQDEVVEVDPLDSGFQMNLESMIQEALASHEAMPHWERYIALVLGRAIEPIQVSLKASHDPTAVRDLIRIMADLLDRPANPPILLTDTGFIEPGKAGFVTELEETAQRLEEALYRPQNRIIEAAIVDQPAPEITFDFLEQHLRQQLASFNGVGVLYVLDLETGEEISINGDAAVSGLSIVKVAIMTEALRRMPYPVFGDNDKLMRETAIFSGNYSANLLLDIVAQQDNAYLGVDILTESMRDLGLENTFIATPYEENPRPGRATYVTPANRRTDLYLRPDPAMQTTAEEMGQIFAMLYYCAQGGGAFLAVFPEELSAEKCQYLIDLLVLNDEGNLLRYGVPEGTPVAHKHGWAYNLHGDGGIIFTEGGDYVIIQYLHQDTDWLNAGVTFPLLREISRSVYNYFNIDNPYVDHKRAQKAAGKLALSAVMQKITAGSFSTLPPDELLSEEE